MVIPLLMALAVLFGALVLASLLVGRMYEVRNKVGELNEELEHNDKQFRHVERHASNSEIETDSKEKV